MLAAVAGALMSLEFSVPMMPPFYKIDFSDVPSIIALFLMGPASAAWVMAVSVPIRTLFACFCNAFITLPLYAAAMRLPLNQVITMVAAVNPAISDLPTFIFMATIPFNLLNWGSTALWDICCHQTAGSLSGHKNRVRKRGLISHDNFESCVYNLLIGLYG